MARSSRRPTPSTPPPSAPGANDIPPPPGADRTGGPPPSRAPSPPSPPSSPSRTAPAGEPETRREFVGTGVFWSLIIGAIVALALIIFIIQNSESIRVEFLGFDWSMALAGVVLIAVLAGVLVDEMVGVIYRSRRRRRLSEHEELQRLRQG